MFKNKKSLLCASVTEDYLKMVSTLSENLHKVRGGEVIPNIDATLFALGFQYDNRTKRAKYKLLTTLQDTRAENVFYRKLYIENKYLLSALGFSNLSKNNSDKLTAHEVREFKVNLTASMKRHRKLANLGDSDSKRLVELYDEQFLVYVRHPKYPYLVKTLQGFPRDGTKRLHT